MNISSEVVLEDIGEDYKGQSRAILKIKTFIDGKQIGQPEGIFFIGGRKTYMEAIKNGLMTLSEYQKMIESTP